MERMLAARRCVWNAAGGTTYWLVIAGNAPHVLLERMVLTWECLHASRVLLESYAPLELHLNGLRVLLEIIPLEII